MKAIIIREPWISLILNGFKTWEMRNIATHYRGPVGLIRAGSGLVVGAANLIATHGPFSAQELMATRRLHQVPVENFYKDGKQKWRYAWELDSAVPLSAPVHYHHRSGSVIWVTLLDETIRLVELQLQRQMQNGGQAYRSDDPKLDPRKIANY